MKTGAAVVGAAIALCCAVSAQAATPITIADRTAGDYQQPNVAVDAAGAGHFTYIDFTGSEEVVRYCRIPRGGLACVDTDSFGPVGGDGDSLSGTPQVFARPTDKVDVLSWRCCDQTSLVRSTNGGTSFGARTLPANGIFDVVDVDDAIYGPGDTFTWTGGSGGSVQNGGPSSAVNTSADLWPELTAAQSIGMYNDNIPVLVFQDFENAAAELFWSKYDGSGSLNLASNWTTPQALTAPLGKVSETQMAQGPNGLFLASEERPFGGSDDRVIVRKFTGNGWGAPVVVSTESSNGLDLFQDASGRLHAIWGASNGDGSESSKLRWRTSADGVNWGPSYTLHKGEIHAYPHVSAGADGKGFATWQTNYVSPNTSMRAVPLEPIPDDAVVQPPVVTTPSITGATVGSGTLLPGQGTKFVFNSSSSGQANLTFLKQVKGLKLKQKGKKKLSCLASTKKRLRGLRKSLAKTKAVKKLKGKARSKKLKALVKKRGCKAYKKVGEINQVVTAGRNEIVFTGRLAGKKLSPGTYRVTLTVSNAAGRATKRFTLKVRKK